MKINSIELSWFRGAAHTAEFSTGLKNVAIYGSNGSGKSSFTDAIEYLVKKGRIEHLAHEYSGRRQERGVINTHAPKESTSWIRVSFEGWAHIASTVAPDGTPTFDSDPDGLFEYIQTWQVEHLILRQDEVAAFVKSRKGDKYSVLLPLLGLENLEQAAENIVALRQSVENASDLAGKRTAVGILKDVALSRSPLASRGNDRHVSHNAGHFCPLGCHKRATRFLDRDIEDEYYPECLFRVFRRL